MTTPKQVQYSAGVSTVKVFPVKLSSPSYLYFFPETAESETPDFFAFVSFYY